mgnify:CR=1 FL=1
MGTNYYAVKKKPTIREPLHIGKSSAGWKFLFHEVNKYNSFDWDLEIHTFEQWKEFSKGENWLLILAILVLYEENKDLGKIKRILSKIVKEIDEYEIKNKK